MKTTPVQEAKGAASALLKLIAYRLETLSELLQPRVASRPAFERYSATKLGIEQELACLAKERATLQVIQPGTIEELYALDIQDNEVTLQAQLELIKELISETKYHTSAGLETLLRILFRDYEQKEIAIHHLLAFDDIEDENELSPEELVQFQQRRAIEEEGFRLVGKISLMAELMQLSERRIYETKHIIYSKHQPTDESPERAWIRDAARAYPLIEFWLSGGCTLKELSIPENIAAWMEKKPGARLL